MKKKINWWGILAIIVIGAAVGFVGTGYVKQHLLNNDAEVPPEPVDTIVADNNTDKVDTIRTDTITEGKDSTPIEVNTIENSKISVPDKKNDEKTGKTDSHDIKKEKPKPHFSVSAKGIDFGEATGTKSIKVKSNVSWKVILSNGSDWLTSSLSEGRGDKEVKLTAKANSTNEKREATVTIKWNDNEGQTGSETIKVTQAKATPRPTPVTAEEAQSIVSKGSTTPRIPDNCTVKVNNSATTTYMKFRNEVQKGVYKTVVVSKVEADQRTGNAKTVHVQVTKQPAPPKPITKAEAQAIVAGGNANEKVPDNCRVEVNGKGTTYGALRGKVKSGDYTDVKVASIATDQEGKASTLKLTAKEVVKPTPITKEEVQSVIGKEHSKIPRNCKVVVNNNGNIEYWNFCRGIKLNAYSNVKVKEVTTDASGKATVIKVSATVSEE